MRTTEVLVVQHEPETPAGWVGEGLEAAGVRLAVCRPYAGEPLPADLEPYDGLLVLGGAMDSWDDEGTPWLPATRALVQAAERAGAPTLGICLGHQVAAAALGGTVGRNPAGATIAVLPVSLGDAADADPLFAKVDLPAAVHWNNDVVLRLPPDAEVLAVTPDGAVQAARLGRAVWGVQFHPEAGSGIVGAWIAGEGAALAARGLDTEAYLAAIRAHEPLLADAGRELGTAFAALVEDARR